MGAVYLANQLSLERKVALKVMDPRWASNPTFMARFTREAYAAAQLVHHNIVQVYDIGEDRGVSFFSMEFVEGCSLAELVKRDGKLDPPTAVAYTIQAARGLKFGHDRGMIHRDVKPDNLMLNDQGVVKVADLGLVKTPEMTASDDAPVERPASVGDSKVKSISQTATTQVTLAGTAMGTPAYMSPEQARDAARVDARADVYSLGCTLYVLLTGKPPFVGNTALEVLSKHASQPVVPPDAVVKGLPKELSDVLLKMVAKKPADRFADMGQVIAALEEFEATQGRGRVALGEDQAAVLDAAGKEFHAAPAARLRSLLPLGFFGGCALLFVLTACLNWQVAGAFLALAVLTPVFYAVLTGVMQRTHLFARARELARETRPLEWLTVAGGALLVLVIVFAAQLWGFVAAAVFAAGFAVAFYYFFDRRLGDQRRPAVDRVEAMLRSLRLQGVEEEALREFVCKYSGEHWEELYEALFGYEAKLEARERWGRNGKGQPRPRFAAWRDPVYRWIEARLKARREAREKKLLQAVEQKNLQAQGVDAAEAEARAEAAAEVMVEKAAQFREASKKAVAVPAEAAPSPDDLETQALRAEPLPPLVDVKTLLEVPTQPAALPVKRRRGDGVGKLIGGVFGLLFGGKMRFVVGALLLTAFVLWVRQQGGALPADVPTDLAQGQSAAEQAWRVITGQHLTPLELPLLPKEWSATYFNGLNVGVAGLILLVSAFFRGWKMALIMWPAAFVAFAGHAFGVVPELGPIQPQFVTVLAGAALAVLGLVFGRGS